MRKGRLLAWGMAAAMVLSFMTGCKSGNEGGSSSAGAQENTQKSASSAGETPAAKDGNKETITLRIGSGHSESNPWITALEDYFVTNVSERVSQETRDQLGEVLRRSGDFPWQ